MSKRRDYFVALLIFLIGIGNLSLINENSTYLNLYRTIFSSTTFIAEIIFIYNFFEYLAFRYSKKDEERMSLGISLNTAGFVFLFATSFKVWEWQIAVLIPLLSIIVIHLYFDYRYKNGKLPYYEYLEFFNGKPIIKLEYNFFDKLNLTSSEHLNIEIIPAEHPKVVTFRLTKITVESERTKLYAIAKRTEIGTYISLPISFISLYDLKENDQIKGELDKDGKSILISKFARPTIKDLLKSIFGFIWKIIQIFIP